MKNVLILCLFLGLATNSHAQNKKKLDSLTVTYQNAQHDTTRILVLNDIAWEYRNSKPDTCINLAKQALIQSEKINYLKGSGISYNNIGTAYQSQSNYPLALEYRQKSLKIKEEIGDKRGIAYCLHNIGRIYETQSNYALALEYQQKSLKIKEEIGDKRGASESLNSLGNIYKNQGNILLALESYQKSLKINEEIKDKRGIAVNWSNIGIVHQIQGNYALALEYQQKSLRLNEELNAKGGMAASFQYMGYLYEDQSNYTLALEYYQKSLKIREELRDKRTISIIWTSIGNIYQNQGNYALALEYYQKSLKTNEGLGNRRGLTQSWSGMAQTYQKQQDYEKGIEYAQKGLILAQELKAFREVKDLSKTLFECYKLKKDYVKALTYLELYKQTQDSLFNVDKAKAIANLEAKVEISQKEQEITLLSKNKDLLEKDNQLQKIENERQRNARLALEKQAEADRLLALAQKEKNQRQQDSLLAVAAQRQLEADKLKANEKTLQAENKARSLEILKEKEALEFQQKINYTTLLGLSMMTLLSFFIYRANRQVLKAKEKVEIQHQEISQQKEEISQQNEALELKTKELERVNHTKDKLFAIIGHDLRSPIASLHGLLTLITIGNLSKEEFNSFSGSLLAKVDNTIFTLDNLLHWANSQMKGIQPQPKATVLSDLAQENLSFMQSIAESKKINLNNLIPEQAQVWADTNQINLVFRNLLSNALKFTPEQGSITFSVSRFDEHWKIAVQDTGIGIPEATRVKIFQNKQHFTTKGTKGEQGTGLGLQLCQEMVEKNGGKIWVESEQGKGTTFFFMLPTNPNS